MNTDAHSIRDVHWQLDMLQTIDVGLVVLDRDYNVQLWNGFMANHSGIAPPQVIGRNLFEVFPELPADWFKRKAESVFMLRNRASMIWEQRPYLFRFKSYRPITGFSEIMYQNVTLIPLGSADGSVQHISIVIYDVTDNAVGKLALEKANKQLNVLSRTDSLTQLNNRGFWEEAVVNEFQRLQRTTQPTSLIMFDIDHFKRVNDGYGHPAGDEVIRITSKIIRETIRATDVAGRYGGEEFGILLINTDAEGAMILSERLRKRIEETTVEYEDYHINFTISLGIAVFDAEMSSHEQWIDNADQGLYEAKESGRNQSIIYRDA